MATMVKPQKLGGTAGGAVKAFRLVKLTAAGRYVHTAAVTDKPEGVSLNDAANGEPLTIATFASPKLKVTVNSAVSRGDQLGVASAAGKADDVVAVGNLSIGTALQAATADNDIIEFLPELLREHA